MSKARPTPNFRHRVLATGEMHPGPSLECRICHPAPAATRCDYHTREPLPCKACEYLYHYDPTPGRIANND